jgi:hypothetical protein
LAVASISRSTARSHRSARSPAISVARRIHRGDLSCERLGSGGVGRAATSGRPNDTHARTEHDDTGEEQQRFAFGGGWHDAKIASPITNRVICLFPTWLFLRIAAIMLHGRCYLESLMAAISCAPPSMK